MIELAFEYFIIVFLMCLAVIQAAGSYNYLAGIAFFQNRLVSFVVSALMLATCMSLLLTWNLRNYTGIIEGAQQFVLFMAAITGAIIVTALVSSAVNHKRFKNVTGPLAGGIEALRTRTFLQAMQIRLRRVK